MGESTISAPKLHVLKGQWLLGWLVRDVSEINL